MIIAAVRTKSISVKTIKQLKSIAICKMYELFYINTCMKYINKSIK